MIPLCPPFYLLAKSMMSCMTSLIVCFDTRAHIANAINKSTAIEINKSQSKAILSVLYGSMPPPLIK